MFKSLKSENLILEVPIEAAMPIISVNQKILVVDSELASGQQICTLLDSYGFQTSHLASHQQALNRIYATHNGSEQGGQPDLIISDLLGDAVDGLEFLRDIRKLGQPHIPVMIVTSLDSNSTFEKAVIDLGADDFVLKPIRHSELLLRVRVLLRGLPGVAAWRGPELL